MQKNILVTGGAGYIGSHTCLALIEKGFNVKVMDNFCNSSPKSLEAVSDIAKNAPGKLVDVINGDIRSQSDTRKAVENVDGVIHFAGLKSVAESNSNPLQYWDINVNGSINLLKEFIFI